ncbi:LysR substrate-binding domain-containing protein, partial [Acinetobacter baumannii]
QQGTDMVSILPTAVAEMFVKRGMLRILPVKLRSMSQTIGIVTRKGGQLSMAGQAFVRLLQEGICAA